MDRAGALCAFRRRRRVPPPIASGNAGQGRASSAVRPAFHGCVVRRAVQRQHVAPPEQVRPTAPTRRRSARPAATPVRRDVPALEILAERDRRVLPGHLLREDRRAGPPTGGFDPRIAGQRRQVETRMSGAAVARSATAQSGVRASVGSGLHRHGRPVEPLFVAFGRNPIPRHRCRKGGRGAEAENGRAGSGVGWGLVSSLSDKSPLHSHLGPTGRRGAAPGASPGRRPLRPGPRLSRRRPLVRCRPMPAVALDVPDGPAASEGRRRPRRRRRLPRGAVPASPAAGTRTTPPPRSRWLTVRPAGGYAPRPACVSADPGRGAGRGAPERAA